MKHAYLLIGICTVIAMGGCQGEPRQRMEDSGPNDLINAIASYEYSREMYVDSVHRVELVISKEMDRNTVYKLAPSLAESKSVKDSVVKIGDAITANLIDPSAGELYKITPLSLETQRLLTKDTFGYLWQWDVIPLTEGNHPLRLKATTEINGYPVNIPVFDTNIRVISRKNDGQPVLLYVGLGALLLIGFITFALRKKKQDQKEEETKLSPEQVNRLNDLIGMGETLEAMELLEQHLEAHHSDKLKDLILLKSSWQDNRRKSNLNVIDADDANVEDSRIKMALLELMDELKTDKNTA